MRGFRPRDARDVYRRAPVSVEIDFPPGGEGKYKKVAPPLESQLLLWDYSHRDGSFAREVVPTQGYYKTAPILREGVLQ